MSGRSQTAHGGSFYEDVESDTLRRLSDFSISDWMRKLGEAEVFESDLQHLILNYLTINGLAGPAEEFIKEARIDPQMPLHCIDCRAKIREAILSGQTDEAIRQIGFIDPNGDPEEAIDFAQQRLAPCVKECPHLLPQLEEVMALLAFTDLSCPEAQRLIGGMEQREETARRIDEAILDLYRIEQESALELLTKNVLFSQGCLQNTQRSLCPVVVDIRRATLGRTLGRAPGQRNRGEEGTDTGGAHSGGESGVFQVDALDQQPAQETQPEGASHRHSQATTSTQVPVNAPRRNQGRDQSRDFGRRRRAGGAPQ
ncbi:CTLH domain-containing protein, related [Eimeria acervulina]|uniref:CTLH domain-containing protein, related n=1 Tax=Eimeria acervulina TaxID=5801 RepID=U6GLX8_EIMAC|nr:CTLH domain-containing protein, related [Eimeria acervulina]CDI80552.1 CTLH domain-containing protein, related [Eimeria acervulina]